MRGSGLRQFVLGVGVSLAAASGLHAQDQAALAAARAQIIGAAIASGPDFTVHSPQAVAAGGSFRCGTADPQGYLALTLQHAPADPQATIIPFDRRLPAAPFVASLNALLSAFLATCEGRGWVTVSHVYRDHFPAGVDVARRYERPITAFNYVLTAGRLSLDPVRNTERWVSTWGFNDAPQFTLAGARTARAAVQEERERASATYRQAQADGRARQPGIVYRGDRYWAQYVGDPVLETVRRVFDGDFKDGDGAEQHTRWRFKAAFNMFGESWSRRCRAHITDVVAYHIPWQEVTRTRTYLDGHVEHDYRTRVEIVEIDRRFTPHWGEYRPAVVRQILEAIGAITEEMGSLTTASNEAMIDALRKTRKVSMTAAWFQQHACDSATMLQLRENLVRAANRQPSWQQDGGTHPRAAAESDPPER